MLEVTNLSRSYGSFIAVDNVSFHIGKGAIVGLLGQNGAGKTTIMKIISGYLEPDSGTVSLDGINLASRPQLVKSRLGYLPETLPFYPELSVADFLDYAADLKGLKNHVKRAEISRVIEATDISAKLLAPISTLSRGYRQRLGVAQALLGQPRLLILDEPTNGLDPEQTRQMRQLIRQIARDATVILSTHIMQEVDAVCSRVLILRAGQLAVDAALEQLRRSNILQVQSSLRPTATAALAAIDGVTAVTHLPGREDRSAQFSYRITLANPTIMPHVSALIAAEIAAQDQRLYLLQPEQRDLESLFRQATEETANQGGLVHAA